MKIAAFQMDIAWENPETNRAKIEQWLSSNTNDADIIVLPEMFTTGFSMHPDSIAEDMQGKSVQWLVDMAQRLHKALIGSIAIRTTSENGTVKFHNRLFFVGDDGVFLCYDKRHLFRMSGEHNYYETGRLRQVIHYKGIRILPLICYDLRFPVWSRSRNDYDLLIYVANWPETRSYAWSTLLKARAIENQSYVVGVNRCGKAPKDNYSGDTVILDFMGQPLSAATPYKEEIITADIDLDALNKFRNGFPAYLDADHFTIED